MHRNSWMETLLNTLNLGTLENLLIALKYTFPANCFHNILHLSAYAPICAYVPPALPSDLIFVPRHWPILGLPLIFLGRNIVSKELSSDRLILTFATRCT